MVDDSQLQQMIGGAAPEMGAWSAFPRNTPGLQLAVLQGFHRLSRPRTYGSPACLDATLEVVP